ncbi:putative odorant receptor 71a [Culex quinquefasciatus]|nr:putative odorant receptor 71a [Culex quinquefasciatus]
MARFGEYIPSERLTFWIWKILGIWATQDESRLYRAFRWIYHFTFTIVYLFCIFISSFFKETMAELWSDVMFILLTELAMFTKTVITVRKFETVYRLHWETISDEFRPISEWETRVHGAFFSRFSTAMLGYYLCSFLTLWAHLGFLFEYKFPFFSWFFWLPLGRANLTNYYIIFAYQMFGMLGHLSLNVSGDIQHAYLLATAGIQLDFLYERLTKLPIPTSNSSIGKDHYRETLIQHIEHYERIYRFVKEIEDTFSMAIFVQICASGVTVCATILRLSTVNLATDLGTDGAPMVFYLVAMLTQIFLPCYFGNEVTLKSVKLTNALYTADWFRLAGVSDRKEMAALMLRTNKPIALKAGHFFNYNLEAFTSTLNTAYSIYAVVSKKNREQA